MNADLFATLAAGERIVVRYRIDAVHPGGGHDAGPPAAGAGPRLSDALGKFVSLRDGNVTVETHNGSVTIPRSAVTHAKRVPPAPPRRGGRRAF